MTEVAVSVASKVAESLVAPMTLPFRYFWNYKSNVQNLENEVKKLEGRRETVLHSVEDAKSNGEEIMKHVETWLDSVKNIIDEATELINDDKHQQANMKGCKGFSCTNLKKRYQHSKKAVAKLKDVVGAQEEASKFEKVSFRTIPEETWLQSSNRYQAFEERKSILKNIIDAFRNPDVNVVGIYGMGGIGKTTLAKDVAEEAKEGTLFHVIIFVEVSQTPDIKIIQGVIADKLGLKIDEESVPGRARRLCDRIKKEEKILLILDNIWGSVNFEIVGIPLKNDHKGLKLLLTTRNSDVLTNQMDSQCNFHIKALNELDALTLFKSIAGTCIDSPDLQATAAAVAKECEGVPIAIVTIAKALKNKGIHEWEKALRELRNPSSDSFGGIAREAYISIQLSYDNLENRELKEIFLLCSRMGRTYDASVQDLLIYGWGLGLFEKFNTLEEALRNLYAVVNTLKATSLLLDAPKGGFFIYGDVPDQSERFAMHDVVCDVARSIASRDRYVFTVTDAAIPRTWEKEGVLKNCVSITLYNIGELPKHLELVCPQLKFLYVKLMDSFSQIPDCFFVWMPSLQVLHLVEIDLRPLPTSFGGIADLQTLWLEGCKLGDIAIIGNLKKLEILNFHYSEFKKLPEEIRELTSLRLLDLSHCYKLEVIPPGVFSSLTQLEALYMDPYILNDELLKGLLLQKLEIYRICIGSPGGRSYEYLSPRTSRMLRVQNPRTNVAGIISQLKGIQELVFANVPGLRNILHDLVGKGFPELKHLTVKNNNDCLFISEDKLDISTLPLFNHKVGFPNLEEMVILNMANLKMIWHNQLADYSFSKLRSLEIRDCNKLLALPRNMFERFSRLESLYISECASLEEIFDIQGANSEKRHSIVATQLRHLYISFLPNLKHVWNRDPQGMFSFGNLQNFTVSNCQSLKNLFPASVALGLSNLEELSVGKCGLEDIITNEGVVLKEEAPATFRFPKLASLELSFLPKLRSFYPRRHTVVGPVLKELTLLNCGKVKIFTSDVVSMHDTSEEGQLDILIQQPLLVEEAFPYLEKLELSGKNVMMMWQGQVPKCLFHKLKILLVWFDKSSVLPLGIIQSFQNLEELSLSLCSYKEIFSKEEVQIQAETITNVKKLALGNLEDLKYMWKQDSRLDLIFQNLEDLRVLWCKSLINLFPPSASFQNLAVLEVLYCKSLINIMTSSTAKSLVQLIQMKIKDCRMIVEVVGNQGDVAEDKITFSKLKSLSLKSLSSLTSFCFGNCVLEFPSLKKLTVKDCDKMKNFSEGVLRTPTLREVKIGEEFYDLSHNIDLNTAITQNRNSRSTRDNIASSSS